MGYRKIAALLFALIMASSTHVAIAHDVVISSDPADGGTVSEFPRKITLEFSGIPKDSFNTVAVSDTATSEVLFRTEPDLNQQFVSVEVPDDIRPGPGEYLVGFQITSSDGHATRGKVTFQVAGEKETSSETSTTKTTSVNDDAAVPSSEQSNFNGWYVGGVIVLIVAALAAFASFKRK